MLSNKGILKKFTDKKSNELCLINPSSPLGTFLIQNDFKIEIPLTKYEIKNLAETHNIKTCPQHIKNITRHFRSSYNTVIQIYIKNNLIHCKCLTYKKYLDYVCFA